MDYVTLWRLDDEYGQQRDRWFPTQRQALAAACLRYGTHPDKVVARADEHDPLVRIGAGVLADAARQGKRGDK